MKSDERKKRLELLLERQKVKNKLEYGALFDECIEALGDDVTVYSETKGQELYD